MGMRKVLYILGHLNDEDVEWMARAGRRVAASGHELIRENEPSDDLYFVLEGEVMVSVGGLGEVARLGPGEVVGEMELVDSAPPSATVVGGPGCLVLALDRESLELRLRREPGFAGRFYKALAIFLADRLRATADRRSGRARPEIIAEDELDDAILDQVSVAGARFAHIMKQLSRGAR
jgi:CRP-like cAMP-binding protein